MFEKRLQRLWLCWSGREVCVCIEVKEGGSVRSWSFGAEREEVLQIVAGVVMRF